jgi:hypothetical protein
MACTTTSRCILAGMGKAQAAELAAPNNPNFKASLRFATAGGLKDAFELCDNGKRETGATSASSTVRNKDTHD